MDSELDCDKMDYLLRDSLYCGVNYGKYDVERLISCLTIYVQDGIPRLAIEYGGIHAFEEFMLARYFMFIQVYFHRTRRYFDIILAKALTNILPSGTYPSEVSEYLKWDDYKVFELIKQNMDSLSCCNAIISRIVYPTILETKPHPQSGDKRVYEMQKKNIFKEFNEEYFIEDNSAEKMPHKIPIKVEIDSEKAIIIVDNKLNQIYTITDVSHIINTLTEKIDIRRLYVEYSMKNKTLAYVESIS